VEIRDLTRAEAAEIGSWRYPGRYATYDVDDPSILEQDHWAVVEHGVLVGYCCFGPPARVPGAQAEPGTLDVGYGCAPNRMGHGHGTQFVRAILEFACKRYDAQRLRLFILEWNVRSRTVASRLGFSLETVLQSDEGAFVVMVRNRHDPPHQPRRSTPGS
jgi:[ribosomal protein S18]-alanine N-acetyltransferase